MCVCGGGVCIGEGTDHSKITEVTEEICPLLSFTLSETTEGMFPCDVAQIIRVLKACHCMLS